jgi:Transposase DDE domain group 1
VRPLLDVDAALLGSHFEKEGAAGNFGCGFGFHPMLRYLEGSDTALDGVLRPDNAGSNAGDDQLEVLEATLEQLPPSPMKEEILVRGNSAFCVQRGHRLLTGRRHARRRL